MVNGVGGPIIFDDVCGTRTGERPSHAGETIRPGDFLVAGGAERGVYIMDAAGGGAGGSSRMAVSTRHAAALLLRASSIDAS